MNSSSLLEFSEPHDPLDRFNCYRALTCLPIQLLALAAWQSGVQYNMASLQIAAVVLLFLLVDINYVQHYHAHGSLFASPLLKKIAAFQLGVASGMDIHNWHLHHIYMAHHDLRAKNYPGKMSESDKRGDITPINSLQYVAKSFFPIVLFPTFKAILNIDKTYEFTNSRNQVERINYAYAVIHQATTWCLIFFFIYSAPVLFGLFYLFVTMSTILTNYITHKANGRYFRDGAIYLNPTYNAAQLLFGLHAAHHRKNGHYTQQVSQLRHMLKQGQVEQAQIVTKWYECFLWSGLLTMPGLLSIFGLHPVQRSAPYRDFLLLREEMAQVFNIREESFLEYVKNKFTAT